MPRQIDENVDPVGQNRLRELVVVHAECVAPFVGGSAEFGGQGINRSRIAVTDEVESLAIVMEQERLEEEAHGMSAEVAADQPDAQLCAAGTLTGGIWPMCRGRTASRAAGALTGGMRPMRRGRTASEGTGGTENTGGTEPLCPAAMLGREFLTAIAPVIMKAQKQVAVRARPARIQLNRLLKMLASLGRALQLLQDDAEVVVADGGVPVNGNHLAKALGRGIKLAARLVEVSQVDPRALVPRSNLNRPIQTGDGFGRLSHGRERYAEVDVRIGIVSLQRQRPPTIRDGPVMLPHGRQDRRQAVVIDRRLRAQDRRPSDQRLGDVIAP